MNIDDDILAAARELAKLERKTVGEVISLLARQALSQAQPAIQFRNRIPQLPIRPGAKSTSLELIKELMDELP